MSQPPQLARSEAEHLRSLLREPSERTASATFVIEGPHLLERAMETAPEQILSAYFTSEAFEKFSTLRERLERKRVVIYLVSAKQSERISDTRSPQGVFALIVMSPASNNAGGLCVIIIDGVQDPGNVGTIIRAAAWFGARKIILGNNSADPYSPKVLRSTQGEIFSVSCESSDDLATVVSKLKTAGCRILTTTLDSSACSIYREEFSDTVAIVFGNEARGVSKEIATLSDKTITIPRFGSGESLNVAMSAAIILSELARKKETESGKKGKLE